MSTTDTELERIVQYRNENPNELTGEKLQLLEEEIRLPKEKTISDDYFDFKLWCRGYPSRQEAFAEYIDQVLPIEKSQSVLEVGGGRIGRVSRMLAGRGYQMTCMDPKLEVSDGERNRERCAGRFRAVKESFDYCKTSLAGYDWVVAQEPCDATEHVIRACLEQNVPFFMTLCGVPHRLLSGEMPESVWDWYRYLENCDRERTGFELINLYTIARVAVIYSR
ncbi:MAG: hypothetical protein Q4F21_09040 [Lachnospiraceae bacterium]|nr:hypothetical protein [Lachnospiraceae bacterium]